MTRRQEARKERIKKRWDKRRRKKLLYPSTKYCIYCGGDAVWCESCGVYNRICCENYGSCLCS